MNDLMIENALDTATILVTLTYFSLWYDRDSLKGWQVVAGNIATLAFTIISLIRIIRMFS